MFGDTVCAADATAHSALVHAYMSQMQPLAGKAPGNWKSRRACNAKARQGLPVTASLPQKGSCSCIWFFDDVTDSALCNCFDLHLKVVRHPSHEDIAVSQV